MVRKDNILGASDEGLKASFLPLSVDNCKPQPTNLSRLIIYLWQPYLCTKRYKLQANTYKLVFHLHKVGY